MPVEMPVSGPGLDNGKLPEPDDQTGGVATLEQSAQSTLPQTPEIDPQKIEAAGRMIGAAAKEVPAGQTVPTPEVKTRTPEETAEMHRKRSLEMTQRMQQARDAAAEAVRPTQTVTPDPMGYLKQSSEAEGAGLHPKTVEQYQQPDDPMIQRSIDQGKPQAQEPKRGLFKRVLGFLGFGR